MGIGKKIMNWMDAKTLESMAKKSAKRSEIEQLDDQIKFLTAELKRNAGDVGSKKYSQLEAQLTQLKKKRAALGNTENAKMPPAWN